MSKQLEGGEKSGDMKPERTVLHVRVKDIRTFISVNFDHYGSNIMRKKKSLFPRTLAY